MKWMIASDIHGSATCCRRLLERYEKEGADRLLLLGDILYHGPRNRLPDGYEPAEVISLLNARREDILCVRGNCDTEVDQMVLRFPILAPYAVVDMGARLLYATHGHLYGEGDLPLKSGDVLLRGHTHVPQCETVNGYHLFNPGSVTIPKEGSARGYMTMENGTFMWKDLDGQVWKTCSL